LAVLLGGAATFVAVASPFGRSTEEADLLSSESSDCSRAQIESITRTEVHSGTDGDHDGFPDAFERLACSDPSDADSTPEFVGADGTCDDGLDNDKDGEADGDDVTCADADGDTWPGYLDDCPEIDNPDQLDNDEDRLGAECDPDDDDDDGVPDEDDQQCPDTPLSMEVDSTGCSEGEVDHDGDGICDASALSPDPSVCTGSDNCAEDPNPDQSDSDGDGPGDACDSCPTVESDQRDLDEDGLGDDLRPRCRRRRRAKRSR